MFRFSPHSVVLVVSSKQEILFRFTFLPFITFYSLRIKAILLSLHTYKSNGLHFLPTTLSWDVRGEGGKPCHVLTLMLPWTIMIPPKLLRKSYCDHIHHSWRSQLTKCSNVQWLWEAPYRPSTGLLPHYGIPTMGNLSRNGILFLLNFTHPPGHIHLLHHPPCPLCWQWEQVLSVI